MANSRSVRLLSFLSIAILQASASCADPAADSEAAAETADSGAGEETDAPDTLEKGAATLRYEAERAAASGAVFASSNSGYSGTGYMDYQNTTGDFIEFAVNASAAGKHTLSFRYANGSSSNRSLELSINGKVVSTGLPFQPTGSWRTWSSSSTDQTLNAGTNRIRIKTNGANGSNIDRLDVTPSSSSGGGSEKKYVFVIAMENHDSVQVYGNSNAPYLNGLGNRYTRSTNFQDTLPGLPSEPHYLWMEAGTNRFSDHTFTNDDAPSSSNSTSSTQHLVTQLRAAGKSWMSYQEGINSSTGACPTRASGFYHPKHDPFVFFKDVAGNPPSTSNSYCADHHREISALKGDLANNRVAEFNFITPNQCHDMHGQSGCPSSNYIKAADDYLAGLVPSIIAFLGTHPGVLFIVWDEGDNTNRMPFYAIGPTVRSGYSSSVQVTHSSLLKSIEAILGVPYLSTVSSSNTLSDMFVNGRLP